MGIWFAGGALLLACAFFVSHTAILALGLNLWSGGLEFWWRLGWIPVITLPFSWYGVALWYTGFWNQPRPRLYQRHRIWLAAAAFLTAALVALLVLANPLPSFEQAANLDLAVTLEIDGIPILLLVYVADILLCISLSLDALRHPAPSPRMMGNVARERARPWLIAAAMMLLVTGLLVAGMIFWIALFARPGWLLDHAAILGFGLFDLVVAFLIALTILSIGEAIARYEVFTGKTLPRRGLSQQWRRAVILAMGYAIVIAWSLTAQLRPIYTILLTAALMTTFYALYSWRSLAERDRSIRQLRPFVASQNLYDQLIENAVGDIDVTIPFRALCHDVLNTRMARLVAVGSLAPLVPTLTYPGDQAASLSIEQVLQDHSPQDMCIELDPAHYGGAHWAIPLWSGRGVSGVLFLGEKNDEGIYAQEEIEIARASGERIIDLIASAELARRLMALQRQRLAETQLLDQRARRVLHDDILPQLHAAMLALPLLQPSRTSPALAESSTVAGDGASVVELLSDAHRKISDLLRELPVSTGLQVARKGLVGALRQTVEQEWENSFDHVEWVVEPDAEGALHALAPSTAETLFYAARESVRNAARYGRGGEAGRALNLRIEAGYSDGLKIMIEDDGVGLQTHPTQPGTGHGLALHSAMLAVVGGRLSVERVAGGGTRVTLSLPPPS